MTKPRKRGKKTTPTSSEASKVLGPLRLGLVPLVGFEHFSVGRSAETASLLQDISYVADAGSAVRFIVGGFGHGKTFTMMQSRAAARSQGFVTMHADLSPDRRLYGSDGTARALYAELTRNAATRALPTGDALTEVLDTLLLTVQQELSESDDLLEKVAALLTPMHAHNLGYDFAAAVALYCSGRAFGDIKLMNSAKRWLRGEYTSPAQANADLGIRTIIGDRNYWDAVKQLSILVRIASYRGLLVCLDELVNIQKLPLAASRNANLEQILKIVNDCLQGNVTGLLVNFGATPETLEHPRTGLYSYDALRSRLAPNSFGAEDIRDSSNPVLRLPLLTPEEGLVLLYRLRDLHAAARAVAGPSLPDEAVKQYLQHRYAAVGAHAYQTPRDTIVQFLNLLSLLEVNPDRTWQDLLLVASPVSQDSAGDEFDDLDLREQS